MIESFGYANCTSCKKALALLNDSGAAFEHRDYFRNRFSVDELRSMLERAGLRPADVLSKKSKVYRADPERYNAMTDEGLLPMMVEEPTLLRRPIVFDQTGVVVGFNEARLKELVDRAS